MALNTNPGPNGPVSRLNSQDLTNFLPVSLLRSSSLGLNWVGLPTTTQGIVQPPTPGGPSGPSSFPRTSSGARVALPDIPSGSPRPTSNSGAVSRTSSLGASKGQGMSGLGLPPLFPGPGPHAPGGRASDGGQAQAQGQPNGGAPAQNWARGTGPHRSRSSSSGSGRGSRSLSDTSASAAESYGADLGTPTSRPGSSSSSKANAPRALPRPPPGEVIGYPLIRAEEGHVHLPQPYPMPIGPGHVALAGLQLQAKAAAAGYSYPPVPPGAFCYGYDGYGWMPHAQDPMMHMQVPVMHAAASTPSSAGSRAGRLPLRARVNPAATPFTPATLPPSQPGPDVDPSQDLHNPSPGPGPETPTSSAAAPPQDPSKTMSQAFVAFSRGEKVALDRTGVRSLIDEQIRLAREKKGVVRPPWYRWTKNSASAHRKALGTPEESESGPPKSRAHLSQGTPDPRTPSSTALRPVSEASESPTPPRTPRPSLPAAPHGTMDPSASPAGSDASLFPDTPASLSAWVPDSGKGRTGQLQHAGTAASNNPSPAAVSSLGPPGGGSSFSPPVAVAALSIASPTPPPSSPRPASAPGSTSEVASRLPESQGFSRDSPAEAKEASSSRSASEPVSALQGQGVMATGKEACVKKEVQSGAVGRTPVAVVVRGGPKTGAVLGEGGSRGTRVFVRPANAAN